MSAGLLTKRTTFRGRGFCAVFTSIGLLLACAFSLLEPIRPYYDFAAPISLLSADYAEHLPLSDDVTMAASATPHPPIENEARVTQLFDMDTEPAGWGALSEKWRRAKLDIAYDLEIVARCHANEHNGAFRINGVIRSKRCAPIEVIARITQSSNMLRYLRQVSRRTI